MNEKSAIHNSAGSDARVTRVLLVDDSPMISKLLAAMLEDMPDIQVVGQAADGQESSTLPILLLYRSRVGLDVQIGPSAPAPTTAVSPSCPNHGSRATRSRAWSCSGPAAAAPCSETTRQRF